MARSHVAYKYDDDLRRSILDIFDEAQLLPSAKGRAGRKRGLVDHADRKTSYRIQNTQCSLYKCELCRATSPTHQCPFEVGPPTFCRLCGDLARDHVCTAQARAEKRHSTALARRSEAKEREAAERRAGAEKRRLEAEQHRAARQAERDALRQMKEEQDRRNAAEAAKLRAERAEQRRLREARVAARIEHLKKVNAKPQFAELPPPTFCSECGSAELNHQCKIEARLAAINDYERKRHARRKARHAALEALRQQVDTLPVAAE